MGGIIISLPIICLAISLQFNGGDQNEVNSEFSRLVGYSEGSDYDSNTEEEGRYLECSDMEDLVLLSFFDMGGLYVNVLDVESFIGLSNENLSDTSDSKKLVYDTLGDRVQSVQWRSSVKYEDVQTGVEVDFHTFRVELDGAPRSLIVLPGSYLVLPIKAANEVVYSNCKRQSKVEIIDIL